MITSRLKLFNFAQCFQEVCEKNDLDGISVGRFFLIRQYPDDFLKILMHDNQLRYIYLEEISISPDNTLNLHGIYPAQCFSKEIVLDKNISKLIDYNVFCLTIFQREFEWLKLYFDHVYQYLETSDVFSHCLNRQDMIHVVLAEVLENMANAQVLLEKKHMGKKTQKEFSVFLLQAIKKLSYCSCGKEFAQGNILEFYYVVQLMNHFLCLS
jgi:hypothetical protein